MAKLDVTKFGDSALEQIDNMQFTEGQQEILDYALKHDDTFSDEEYYDLAFYFAAKNGLNNK
jgi:hypothetical protein